MRNETLFAVNLPPGCGNIVRRNPAVVFFLIEATSNAGFCVAGVCENKGPAAMNFITIARTSMLIFMVTLRAIVPLVWLVLFPNDLGLDVADG